MGTSTKTDAELMADYRARMNEEEVLGLASSVADDGLGNTTYTFETSAALAFLP